MKKQTLNEEIHQMKNMMKKVMNKQPINKTINESFWDSIFGKPSVDDAAKTQLKGQGYSHRGKEESGENYLVFNGEKFYPEQIVYADYHDLGKLPRVENGKLIIKIGRAHV